MLKNKLFFFLIANALLFAAIFSVAWTTKKIAKQYILRPTYNSLPFRVRLDWLAADETIQTVLIGASRTENIQNPTSFVSNKMLNLSYIGISIEGIYFLVDFLTKNFLIKKIIIEIPYYSFLKGHEHNPGPLRAIRSIEKNQWDMKYFVEYIKLFLEKYKNNAIGHPNGASLSKPEVIKRALNSTGFFGPAEYDKIEYLEKIIDVCKNKDIEVIFFMGPYHPVLNDLSYLNVQSRLPMYLSFLKEVSQATSFYLLNVFYYNHSRYHHNFGHFNQEIGEKMILDLLAKKFEKALVTEKNCDSFIELLQKKAINIDLKNKEEVLFHLKNSDKL